MPTLKVTPRLAAFLDLIAASEGTSSSPISTADGYDIIVSGVNGPNRFDDFSQHPFAGGREPILVRAARTIPAQVANDSQGHPQTLPMVSEPAIHSTASGRYQIILPTWKAIAVHGAYTLFNPQTQDLAALDLISDHKCNAPIFAGDLTTAIHTLSAVWASLPGNLYGQGGRTLAWLQAKYVECLEALL
jgi:muramidase (phage lysozyme)